MSHPRVNELFVKPAISSVYRGLQNMHHLHVGLEKRPPILRRGLSLFEAMHLNDDFERTINPYRFYNRHAYKLGMGKGKKGLWCAACSLK